MFWFDRDGMFWIEVFDHRDGRISLNKRRTKNGVTTWEHWRWLYRDKFNRRYGDPGPPR